MADTSRIFSFINSVRVSSFQKAGKFSERPWVIVYKMGKR